MNVLTLNRSPKYKKRSKNTFLSVFFQCNAGKPPLSASVLTTDCLFNRAEIGLLPKTFKIPRYRDGAFYISLPY